MHGSSELSCVKICPSSSFTAMLQNHTSQTHRFGIFHVITSLGLHTTRGLTCSFKFCVTNFRVRLNECRFRIATEAWRQTVTQHRRCNSLKARIQIRPSSSRTEHFPPHICSNKSAGPLDFNTFLLRVALLKSSKMQFLKATAVASVIMMMSAVANPIAAPEAGNELEKRATEGVYLLNCGNQAYTAVVVRIPSCPYQFTIYIN